MGDIMINDLMIENFMKVIMDYKKKYGDNATRFEFDEKIISMNNPKLSYFFLKPRNNLSNTGLFLK